MKRVLFLTAVLICSLQYSSVAQTSKKVTPPSDAASGYTYDFDKTNDLIIERLLHPTTSNNDVQIIIDEKTFPKLNKGQSIDADYKKKLASWIEKNPNLIINNLKNRKDIVHPF